jgi:hypothetical protein
MAHNISKRPFDSFAEPNGSKPSSKKPRADSVKLLDKIRVLPIETTQRLLDQICQEYPKLAARVQDTYAAHLAKTAAQAPVNFDHYSKECWYTLNKRYARLRPSQQFEIVGDIMEELSEAREEIMGKAGEETRFETRRNALEVLRKICKSVMLCNEQQIRHELIKDGMVLVEFAESMEQLARGMTAVERERYKEEGLYEKLVELQGECESIDMEGLADVYAVFEEDGGEEEDGEEGNEEDEDPEDPAVQPIPPARKRMNVFSVGELS